VSFATSIDIAEVMPLKSSTSMFLPREIVVVAHVDVDVHAFARDARRDATEQAEMAHVAEAAVMRGIRRIPRDLQDHRLTDGQRGDHQGRGVVDRRRQHRAMEAGLGDDLAHPPSSTGRSRRFRSMAAAHR
jgi:hypothetical protein